MSEILNNCNKFIEAYSYLFTFLGFAFGIFGTAAGLYNYWKKISIIRLRESIISAHLQIIRDFKKGIKTDPDHSRLKKEFSIVYNHFLEMLNVVMEPTSLELSTWQKKGYIDNEDYEYLIKLRLRK